MRRSANRGAPRPQRSQPNRGRTEVDVAADVLWRLFARKLIPSKPHIARFACHVVGITVADLGAAQTRYERAEADGDVDEDHWPGEPQPEPVALTLVANAGKRTEAGTLAKVTKKNPTPTTRRCSRCRKVKPRHEFGVKNARTGTLKSMCAECMKEYQHERYLTVRKAAALQHVLQFVVGEADQCVGAKCPACQRAIAIGEEVRGTARLEHVECPAPRKDPRQW